LKEHALIVVPLEQIHNSSVRLDITLDEKRFVIQEWIKGLRRNDIKQITGKFFRTINGEKYCCGLGIFFETFFNHKWNYYSDYSDAFGVNKSATLNVQDLIDTDPRYNWVWRRGYGALIIYLNDVAKYTFEKQAKYLEDNMELLINDKCPDLTDIPTTTLSTLVKQLMGENN
jgi:hypothetical protein